MFSIPSRRRQPSHHPVFQRGRWLRHRVGFWLLVALTPVAPTLSAPAFAVDPLRCGDELVVRGQRPYEVAERCGAPGYEYQRVEWRYPGILVYVDEWVYDLGNNRFRRELLFENGRLVDISHRGRTPPRGRTAPRGRP